MRVEAAHRRPPLAAREIVVPIADAIRKRGFRRWHERQLIEGHLWLVTGFLAMIMMAIALETVEFRSGPRGFFALVAVAVGGGALCVFAWKRFTAQLFRAEYLSERARLPAGAARTPGSRSIAVRVAPEDRRGRQPRRSAAAAATIRGRSSDAARATAAQAQHQPGQRRRRR